jgi:uncharacterized membrane protein
MTEELYHPDVHERLEAAIEASENRCSAELVVVMAPRAESYRADSMLLGIVTSAITLLALVYLPADVPATFGLLAVLCAGIVASGATQRFPKILNIIVPEARQRAAVERLAKVCFHDEEMTGTRDRTGILFVYGILEEQLVVLHDVGIQRSGGAGPLAALTAKFHHDGGSIADRLEACLLETGEVLEPHLPCPEDDTDELPNEIRILPCP